MTERGILFSAPMVRALLDGSKTQTRRAYKARKHPDFGCEMAAFELAGSPPHVIDRMCPYGQPGDRLWVRETWADLEQITDGSFARQAIYRADDIEQYGDEDEFVDVTSPDMRWRPSIHMPRWASRILLEVVSVRVERLQDISDQDAIAEGIGLNPSAAGIYMTGTDETMPHAMYRKLWEQINGAGSWAANPFVWVVEFKRLETA